jgi:methyl-accepting chemotaxis protein
VELTSFLSSLDPAVKAASIGIVVLTAGAWFTWNPKVNATSGELKMLRKHFDECESPGRDAIGEAVQKTKDVNVRALLAEVQSGLFELPGDLGVKTYSLRFYQDVWTPRALLARKVNLDLYESAPNIIIGIGLLCTFFFLAIALADVLPALRGTSSPDVIRSAIEGLLQNAAGKFLTSISGMFCSLTWTFASKRSLVSLEDEIEALCVAMRRHVEDSGGESAITAQIALLEEILTENREQVGQLKRFETDFAVAIGKALGSQMQPAFERLTHSITNALNALTEKVGSMNEEALRKMLQDFQNAIREHSGREMEAFKQTLIDIADQIKDAATKLEGAGGAAGKAIEGSGKAFTDALSGGAGDLRQAASLLEQAMVTAKATVNDMDETLERASNEGRQGLSNLQDVLARLALTAQQVGDLVARVQGASDDFKSAATAAANATGNLEKVVAAQNSIVTTVSETASTLGTSLVSANNEFKNSAKAIADTTKEMTAGVQNYSQQVADLHSRLDENLAKAIGSLNSTISELVDGLDDFLEDINKRRG